MIGPFTREPRNIHTVRGLFGVTANSVVFLPPLFICKPLIFMEIGKMRRFLLDRGMLYLYSLFIAGYFLLPMATGHRRVYYVLVFPAVLLLWRELQQFYRGNALAILLLVYAGYMMLTLLWTDGFASGEAIWAGRNALVLLSFCFISGFLWIQYPQRMDQLAHGATWLAAAAALISIFAWYLNNPFPASRLEPLGVMHHQNKAGCAYGVFLVLCMHYLFSERGRNNRAVYFSLGAVILSLVIFTQSRTALAGVSVALLVLLGYRAIGFVVVALAASWALLAVNPQQWMQRVETFSFRPGIWEQVLANMEGHWWFGQGYLVDPKVRAYDMVFNHAHNSYLASLRDGGLIGLVLIVSILALAILWAVRLYRDRGERLYLALLLYGMTCISMDFDRLLVHPKELWLFFWLPVALIMAVYPHRRDPGLLRYVAKPA